MRLVALASVLLSVSAASTLGAEEKPTIEGLLKGGWQVAGYTTADDSRSTFILFRHPNETYLVQCRAGYDVTREPRVQTNCYQLR
jgi:hypothetical protein